MKQLGLRICLGVGLVWGGLGSVGALQLETLHPRERAVVVHPGEGLAGDLGFVYAGVQGEKTLVLQNKLSQSYSQGGKERTLVIVPLQIYLTLKEGTPPFLVQFDKADPVSPTIKFHAIFEPKDKQYFVVLIDELQNAWVAELVR